MKSAYSNDQVHEIYNKSAAYYDVYHSLGTLGSDDKGRNILVRHAVGENDYVLDAGGGTGITAIKAGKKAGEKGRVVILDQSEGMLEQAKNKIERMGLSSRFQTELGDMYHIPYPDETFDTVLSSYSTCPLENPLNAVKEMLRVLKKGGLLGIAHSTDPENRFAKFISDCIESLIWKFPRLSLGCRNISLEEDIKNLNVEIVFRKIVGHIPFFFKILVLKKS